VRILFLNGNPDLKNSTFENYCNRLISVLEKDSHKITLCNLALKKIKPCVGCFGCWVKTPGECVLDDDIRDIRKSYVHSDLVIFASPLIMGFTSSLIRSVQEKFIPLVLPYLEIINHEFHHLKRYDNLPLMGLLYQEESDTDDEDIKILLDLYHRAAINSHSKLVLFKEIGDSIEEVLFEINNI